VELSTLILVAVTIAVALAVAFWAATVATQHTGIELLEVKCSAERRGEVVAVTVTVANKGTKAATVVGVEVNGEPKEVQLTVKPGETGALEVEASKADTIQVNVKTGAGEYPCVTSVKG
jgi:uncharacterized protein (DUF58 family)